MNERDFENKLKNESSNVRIEMSERLKNIPISQTNNVRSKKRKFPLIAKFASVCCALILTVCCALLFLNKDNVDKTANLTSYIIEINPSFCITTDYNDKIVNVCALNEDADTVLSNSEFNNITGEKFETCINKIIKIVAEEGYFVNCDNTIKLYAINDKKENINKKLKDFEDIVQTNLNDLGFGHIPFEKYEMEMNEFIEKIGFEEVFGKLDDMFDFLKNKDKHHTPPTDLPP